MCMCVCFFIFFVSFFYQRRDGRWAVRSFAITEQQTPYETCTLSEIYQLIQPIALCVSLPFHLFLPLSVLHYSREYGQISTV